VGAEKSKKISMQNARVKFTSTKFSMQKQDLSTKYQKVKNKPV